MGGPPQEPPQKPVRTVASSEAEEKGEFSAGGTTPACSSTGGGRGLHLAGGATAGPAAGPACGASAGMASTRRDEWRCSDSSVLLS